MARFWKEPLDARRHRDHFHSGSAAPRPPGSGGDHAFFVQVAGFTFEFASVEQIRECLAWFERTVHPSSRQPVFQPEKGHWLAWHERLPARVKKGSRRDRVVRALREAIAAFERAT